MQKSIFPDKYRILSGSMLKLIAMISMLIDHTAFILGPVLPFMSVNLLSIGSKSITLYWIMRKIGRIAFPIFCFLITEGYVHTKNKIKYGLNLLIFAVISELPYDFMYTGLFHFRNQNVFFTLFLGWLVIHLCESTSNQLIKALLMGITLIVSIYLRASYGLYGVLIILLMYMLKQHPVPQAVLTYPLLEGGFAAFTAFLPINLYNGQRGFIKSKIMKYGFYVFYPVHIGILVIIREMIK